MAALVFDPHEIRDPEFTSRKSIPILATKKTKLIIITWIRVSVKRIISLVYQIESPITRSEQELKPLPYFLTTG
jgi:hypothetical protein